MSSTPNVKPSILYIKDIPNDQGGYVKLKWVKSGLDVPVDGTISSYIVERSAPPGLSGYQWEQIGTVLPTQHNTFYYYTAPTPMDSGTSGISTFFFRVTAYTGVGTQLYLSNIMSGYSIDNIAPPAPLNLTGTLAAGLVLLNWSASIVPDFKDFVVYRNGIEIGTVTNLNYTDNSVSQDSIYTYKVSSRDIHGNISPQSNSAVVTFTVSTINIKTVPEGYYNAATNKISMRDTVRAYLRNNISPYNLVDSSKTIIDSVSFNGIFKFLNAPNGTYYIVIKHRNTIETWSRTGGETFTTTTIMNYDYTNDVTKAFGSNMKLIDSSPVRFGIFSGDVNQDGFINLTDVIAIYNDAGNFVTGYKVSDVNGDYFTDLTDVIIANNNSVGFVTVVRP